ncbi:uncharacterized membrane protein YsdA (DUF1294 family) [Novosphingobium sp. PhB55]|uniref:DUF1294 domain-containing protein n=1 Tax=Novosphingobium sp. PhB55 TaxID=2485106 RepID=UPI001067007E|nr:DUF1294 domain-containing protein [Novosphingobium sp. PhB55]TDW62779.1 uncharacterized membrane protein YsdA (DUF1294 family) [Novosphingobium sp. PhB55]
MDIPTLVAAYLALANLIAFFAFAFDKGRAIAGGRRVPERRLLAFAALGGSPGALLARRVLRHKTRKQPFVDRLRWIVTIQVGMVAGLIWAAWA